MFFSKQPTLLSIPLELCLSIHLWSLQHGRTVTTCGTQHPCLQQQPAHSLSCCATTTVNFFRQNLDSKHCSLNNSEVNICTRAKQHCNIKYAPPARTNTFSRTAEVLTLSTMPKTVTMNKYRLRTTKQTNTSRKRHEHIATDLKRSFHRTIKQVELGTAQWQTV